MKLDRHTHRLYDVAPAKTSAQARITRVGPDYIELDATLAYPEGGGQESDIGTIELPDGNAVRFVHAKKMYGHPCDLPQFPGLLVGGVIWHMVSPEDLHLLERARAGMPARVTIDGDRRSRLSLSHSASHLVYLGVARHRPDAITSVLGCHIRVDDARFDFGVTSRFTPEEVTSIEETANGYVLRDSRISLSADPACPDARRWHCEDMTIPCGGTHIDRAGWIGPITIRRTRLGAGKERLSCRFSAARIPPMDSRTLAS